MLIKTGSFLDGKTISELKLNADEDCSVAGVVRDEKLHSNPDQNFRFQADDRAANIGTDSAREIFFQLTVPESGIVKKTLNQN